MKLLLVEDETRVADFVQRGLQSEGYLVTTVSDGKAALAELKQQPDGFDVILLDVMLPGISGIDVCKRLRSQGNHTPILMLTALDQVDDRINGLRDGADDYLAKPFDFDELIARINALMRRANQYSDNDGPRHLLQCGRLRFNTRTLEVFDGEQGVDLSGKERELLKMLLLDLDRVHSRERILNSIWGVSADPMTNVIDVYISRLRKKIGDAARIETVRGAGYRLRAGEH